VGCPDPHRAACTSACAAVSTGSVEDLKAKHGQKVPQYMRKNTVNFHNTFLHQQQTGDQRSRQPSTFSGSITST
jgi:hypothetical protein